MSKREALDAMVEEDIDLQSSEADRLAVRERSDLRMAENEEPAFRAAMNALISNGQLDRLIADLRTNPLAKWCGESYRRQIVRTARVHTSRLTVTFNPLDTGQ